MNIETALYFSFLFAGNRTRKAEMGPESGDRGQSGTQAGSLKAPNQIEDRGGAKPEQNKSKSENRAAWHQKERRKTTRGKRYAFDP